MPRFRQLIILSAIASVLILLIHACQVKPSRELTPLRIGLNNWPGYALAIYAQEAGIFKKRGLAVELVHFYNQQDNIRATIRGALDASFVPLWEVMQVDSVNDKPVYLMVVDVSVGSDGIVARSPINSVADLRGKKVGVKLGTVSHLVLLEALNAHQVKPEEIMVEDVSNEIAIQRLQQGKIDAAVVWEPLLSQTQKAIKGKIIHTTADVESLVIDGLASRSQVIAQKKEAFIQFILAWFDAIAEVDRDPERVFGVIGKQLGLSGQYFAQDYSGLRKGDIEMNRQMLVEGELSEAVQQMVKLLDSDPRHGRIIREDVAIDSEMAIAAINTWQP